MCRSPNEDRMESMFTIHLHDKGTVTASRRSPKELGVLLNASLKLSHQCANAATAVMGDIKSSLIHLFVTLFVHLFTIY